MRSLRVGGVGIACLTVVGVACSRGLLKPGPEGAHAPNAWRLVIEIGDQGARLVSKKPVRTRVLSAAEQEISWREQAADIAAGRVFLVEYEARGPSGVDTGRFLVSRQAHAEWRDPRTGKMHGSSSAVGRVVFRTMIPYRADIETVELTRLPDPDPEMIRDARNRIPWGTLSMMAQRQPGVRGPIAPVPDYVVGLPQRIHGDGDPERLNIVILGDGFTGAALAVYRRIVDELKDELLATHPLGALQDAFNVYRIDVRSDELGTTYPPSCGNLINSLQASRSAVTALSVRYGGEDPDNGQQCSKLISDDKDAIWAAAGLIPGYDDYVIVLVNDWFPAGTAYFANRVAYVSSSRLDAGVSFLPGDKPEPLRDDGPQGCWSINSEDHRRETRSLTIHELGHAAFNLADEYDDQWDGSVSHYGPGGEPSRANVTIAKTRAGLKWKDLVMPATPVPTESCGGAPFQGASDLVGLFEGAFGKDCGIYRPQASCRMNTTYESRPFCAVCRRKIVHTLARYLKPRPPRRPPNLPDNIVINPSLFPPNRLALLLDTLTLTQSFDDVFLEYETSSPTSTAVTGRWPAVGIVDFVANEPQRIEALARTFVLAAPYVPDQPVQVRLRIVHPVPAVGELRPAPVGLLGRVAEVPFPDSGYPLEEATRVITGPQFRLTVSLALYTVNPE